MADTLKFDVACITPETKTAFAYRAQEVLRLEHNIVGKWFREGIKQAEYDQLSASVKTMFKYSELLLSEKDWKRYLVDIFTIKNKTICHSINENTALLLLSTKYDINLDNLLETK
uniref:Uncharacterized protein n=1 Tax=viral metagenome TaxID=1070528 RepID=A0A6M3LWY1_9ZZZZ